MKAITAILLILTMTGCASGPNGLGSSATAFPSWDRLKEVAIEAVKDPHVWAPIAGGVVLQFGSLNQEISDNAREDTPLFGSEDNAKDMSDLIKDITQVAYISTALAIPAPEGDWFVTKTKLLTAEVLTVETTRLLVTELNATALQDRPNERDLDGMPSGHASTSSVQAQLAVTNIDYLNVSDTTKQALTYSVNSLPYLTAWARVEAGWHYPDQTLFGLAIGRFMGHMTTAFLLPNEKNIMIIPQVAEDTAGVTLVLNF